MSVVAPPPSELDEFASRAGSLYSLPAVAVEVLALTDNPRVDVRALKECIQRDPALTAKLLRVVNSSLFGLSREVGDLNQALALLGVKPLKMLVLGFSLPENLLAAASREQLAWYWRHTLARAVAAREIAEQIMHRAGDEAFLAGLLQDIGALVLLGELGASYAEFLREVVAREDCLHHVQVAELGFDHTELSARLLEKWNMPPTLVAAIAEPRVTLRLAKLDVPHAATARTLHLADLTAQLVADRRFAALPDLLGAARMYCGMDRSQIDALIGSLEPKVAQLADVLSLHVDGEQQYGDLIAQGHRRLAEVAEAAATDLATAKPSPAPGPLQAAPALRDAVEDFLSRREQAASRIAGRPAPQERPPAPRILSHGDGSHSLPPPIVSRDRLVTRLTLAVGACRVQRQSLSTLAVAIDGLSILSKECRQIADNALRQAWRHAEIADPLLPTDDPAVHLGLLADCPRHEAVRMGDDVVRRVRHVLDGLYHGGRLPPCRVAAGVATVTTPAKNFPPAALLETALRCLAASQRSAGALKSLEIS